jgi:predicted enzyme related to lactoylglutathione lyase
MAKKKSKKARAKQRPAPKLAKGKSAAKKSAVRKSAPKAVKAARPKGNEIVHWEIQSNQPERLHKFYSRVFGWKIDANNPMNYGIVSSKGQAGIDGGIGGTDLTGGSRVVVYASVREINATLSRIEAEGGRTMMPRTDIGPVIIALYGDPEGNVMGLIEG